MLQLRKACLISSGVEGEAPYQNKTCRRPSECTVGPLEVKAEDGSTADAYFCDVTEDESSSSGESGRSRRNRRRQGGVSRRTKITLKLVVNVSRKRRVIVHVHAAKVGSSVTRRQLAHTLTSSLGRLTAW